MFETRLSKFLYWVSGRLRQKALYFELKLQVKRGAKYFKVVRPYDIGSGKTYTLIQLAYKYNCPIAVPNEDSAHMLRFYSRYIKKPVTTVVCTKDRLGGKRFQTILCEEGIDQDVINNVLLPHSECVVGYRTA